MIIEKYCKKLVTTFMKTPKHACLYFYFLDKTEKQDAFLHLLWLPYFYINYFGRKVTLFSLGFFPNGQCNFLNLHKSLCLSDKEANVFMDVKNLSHTAAKRGRLYLNYTVIIMHHYSSKPKYRHTWHATDIFFFFCLKQPI